MTITETTSGASRLNDAILRRCAGWLVEKQSEIGARFIAHYVAQKPQEA